MIGWELAIGLYPGILIGARSYPEKQFIEHVIAYVKHGSPVFLSKKILK